MPAKSKAQQRLLFARFGEDWVRRHHFANKTKNLPEHADPRKHLTRRRKKGT